MEGDERFVGQASPEIQPWIQSWTGKRVDLLDPRPEQIDYRDIAHHLSQVNRFTGACFWPYNVAQHSVGVARRAGVWDGRHYARLPEARYGLLHDASEAYLGDVSSPLKRLLAPLYLPLEESFTLAIALKYNLELTPEIEEAVKRADLELLASEKRDLLGAEPEPWGLPYAAPRENVEPLISRRAECLFLEEFHKLFPEVP